MQTGTTTIGGRKFRSGGQSTLERDLYVMGFIRAANLDDVPMLETETAEQYALRLMSHLAASSHVLDILGGLFIPEDVSDREWTAELGAETARFLKGLTEPADKAVVQTAILSVLIPFLESGLGSLVRTAAS
jgi:hypothetical protein